MEEVANWLKQLGMSGYVQGFVENHIDFSVLLDLTDQDLKDLGLVLGDRKKLLRAIADLKERGKDAAATGITAAPLAPSGKVDTAERRQVTAMFSDLVGSTALAARMDPEDLREVISVYQKCVAETVCRFGGFVAKYLGAGVLVYFGYPQAHEDDAERAVRAGLELIVAVGRLQSPVPLLTRVGMATGLVVVGDLIGSGASQEQAIVGETPNVAARLQAIAEPNTIVLAESTRKLLGSLFELKDLGTEELKGIPEPVRAFAALGPGSVESRFEALHGGALTELVGREKELDVLLRCWLKAKSNQGQVVLLSGEAGIGKSRLLAALLEHVAKEPHSRLRYYCSPHHTDSALYPIIAQIERAAGLTRDDAAQDKLEKLDAMLARSSTSKQDAALIADLLSFPNDGRSPVIGLTPPQRRQRTLEALVAHIASHATQNPVLVILEDAHWIDPTTQEFLGLLLNRARDAKLMAVVTHRHDFQSPWTVQENFSQVVLDRLDHGSSAVMVEHVTGGRAIPAEIREQIIIRTDGVPLFIEEVTQAVLESGLLRQINGRFEFASRRIPLAIPMTLADSLMARLDRLGRAKKTAQVSAILGRTFSYTLLHAVLRCAPDELKRDLDKLVGAGILNATGTTYRDSTYIFRHALIQEIAYESLLRRSRQEYHQQIAQVLLDQFSEVAAAQPEVVARHFTSAGLASTAITFWTQAGQFAMQRSANLEAITHLTTALDLLGTLQESPERDQQELALRVLLAMPLTLTRGWAAPEVGATYRRASELTNRYGEALQLFPTLVGVFTYYLVSGQYHTASQMSSRNLQIAERFANPELVLEAELDRGTCSYYMGRFQESLPHLDRVIELYNPEVHHHHIFMYGKDPGVVALVHKGGTLWNLGYPDKAMRIAQTAKALTQRWIHPFSDIWAEVGLAFAHQVNGNAKAVAEISKTVMAKSSEQVFPNWLAQGMVFRGWSLTCLGEPDRGIELMRPGLDLWEKTGAELFKTYLLYLLADGCHRAHRLADAGAALDLAFRQCQATEEWFWEAELYRLRGELFLTSEPTDTEAAETNFRLALERAKARSQRLIELRAATHLARLRQSQGRINEARSLLEPIYSWFTEGFDTNELMAARRILATLNSGFAQAH
jgi:class 3 adenylate cyclase/predicted ATPase/ABC-type lipoprotein export system ATPase subunit